LIRKKLILGMESWKRYS